MKRSRLISLCGFGALLFTLAPSLLAAADLLDLVSHDAGACLHVKNLKENLQRIEESEFARRLKETPLYQEWQNGPDAANLRAVAAVVEGVSGTPLRQSIEQLFGQEFALALYASPGQEPRGVVLFEADKRGSIDLALGTWDRLEKQHREKRRHHEIEYVASRKASDPKAEVVWYVILDAIVAISDDETLVKRVIELHSAPEDEESIAENPAFAAVKKRASSADVASLFINPRVWDSHVADDPFVKSAWQRCRWLTLRLVNQNDVMQLDFVADYDSVNAPEWWMKWIDRSAKLKTGNRIPQEALISLTGHVPTDSLVHLVRQAMRNEDLPKDMQDARRIVAGLMLGADPFNDLLPALGPHWLSYVVSRKPSENQARTFPVDALVAIELKPQNEVAEDQPDIRAGLHNTLVAGLNLLAATHNSKTKTGLSTIRQREVNGTWIRWAGPVALFRPAYAITDDHLVLASSPDLCEEFIRAGDSRPPTHEPERTTLQRISFNSTQARRLLKTHEDWFMWKAQQDRVSADEAANRLAELDRVIGLIDTASFELAADDSTIRATLGVTARKVP